MCSFFFHKQIVHSPFPATVLVPLFHGDHGRRSQETGVWTKTRQKSNSKTLAARKLPRRSTSQVAVRVCPGNKEMWERCQKYVFDDEARLSLEKTSLKRTATPTILDSLVHVFYQVEIRPTREPRNIILYKFKYACNNVLRQTIRIVHEIIICSY